MRTKTLILLTAFLLGTFVAKSQILIISADEYAEAMKPYIEWKTQKGMWCKFVTVSETGTTHNEIKAFVAEYHKEHNNRFLLLVGDANSVATHISYGVTNPNEYSAYSDAEYGYIYSTDYPPAVLVGRFSGESIEDIATQVERTIHYEREIDSSATWINSALGIANPNSNETGDNSETDYQHITNLNNRLNEAGYNSSTTNIKTSLIEALNNGCGVLNYIGHGYTTSWQTTGFSTSDVKSLTNNNQLPIIIAAGCQNGHFRLTTCLAESFLRGRDTNNNAIGAVGMLAFTTQIYWNPPMLAQDEFARILVSDSIGFTKNFGEVINAAYKSVIAKYKGSGADVACQWALFGDPSLVLRTKTPTKMIISHKQEIDTEEHTFQVNCDTNSATATLWLNGDIIDTKTVNNGSANLNIENIIDEGFIKLTITAQDKITYQADIKINQSSGIKESTSSSDYKIYPNPSTGEIIICGKDKTIDIRIFDNSGKFILSREIENGIPFSITNESGIYHIHILNDKSTHPIIIRN